MVRFNQCFGDAIDQPATRSDLGTVMSSAGAENYAVIDLCLRACQSLLAGVLSGSGITCPKHEGLLLMLARSHCTHCWCVYAVSVLKRLPVRS